jgi:hypothetical protein
MLFITILFANRIGLNMITATVWRFRHFPCEDNVQNQYVYQLMYMKMINGDITLLTNSFRCKLAVTLLTRIPATRFL